MEIFISVLAALLVNTLITDKVPFYYGKISGGIRSWWKKFKNRKAIREGNELAEKIKEEMRR
jgi:hypothetical protein